jgi:macrolide transport system ATP-binding/permease protein
MGLFRRRQHSLREQSLTDEIQDYLNRETRLNLAAGMSPQDAAFAARKKLGPTARVLEETREASLGIVWRWLELAWRDLRHGVRMFAKNPGFTLTAILSLAFGTGANVAMFSAADALLLRPLPVPHPREIMTIGSEYHNDNSSVLRTSYPNYIDIRDHARSFESLFAYSFFTAGFASEHDSAARVKLGVVATGNTFQSMEVQPVLGRAFRPDEDQVRGRDPVVILSYSLWEELGGDNNILGRAVSIGGIPFTVIGVAPETFTGPDHILQPTFYIPAAMWPRLADSSTLDDRFTPRMTVKGRLKPGMSFSQAQAELDTIARNLERAHPDTDRNQRLLLRTEFQTTMLGNRVYTFLAAILTLLASAVLVVACANVAGLLTSRAPLRAREIALRLAIGAGRARLIRQLLTESSLIALAGGLAGLPLAYLGITIFRRARLTSDFMIEPRFELDQRALLFSLAIAMGSVILFGLIPAIQTTRTNLTSAFKAGAGAEPGRRRLWGRHLLVAIQVAFSLVLLTIAAFTTSVFRGELNQGMGFRSDHIALMTIDPRILHYTDAQSLRFFETLTERAEMLPGVKSAGLTSGMLGTGLSSGIVQPEGYRFPLGQDSVNIFYDRVGENYFETIGIPIVRGRGFLKTDTADAPPVAIVNETFAAHYWPNQNPIGKRIHVNNFRWAEVVGVAKNSHYGYVGEPPRPFFYLPYRQSPQGNLTLLAASAGDSTSLLAPMRNLIADIAPEMPIYDAQTMEQFYAAKVTSFGSIMVEIIGAMGLMGLTLSMVGLYALMAYSVSRRTREIGIRMAVGADRSNVMQMVVRQGMLPVLFGIAIGLLMSAGAGEWLRAAFPLRYDIGPEIYWLMAPVLLSVALLAAFLPARRASLVDPMTALREE